MVRVKKSENVIERLIAKTIIDRYYETDPSLKEKIFLTQNTDLKSDTDRYECIKKFQNAGRGKDLHFPNLPEDPVEKEKIADIYLGVIAGMSVLNVCCSLYGEIEQEPITPKDKDQNRFADMEMMDDDENE